MKISIRHLTKAFPSRVKKGAPVIAVNDMNIEIPSGKLIGLLGPSGCGKSTTLFMLSGLESPKRNHCRKIKNEAKGMRIRGKKNISPIPFCTR